MAFLHLLEPVLERPLDMNFLCPRIQILAEGGRERSTDLVPFSSRHDRDEELALEPFGLSPDVSNHHRRLHGLIDSQHGNVPLEVEVFFHLGIFVMANHIEAPLPDSAKIHLAGDTRESNRSKRCLYHHGA